MIVMKTKLNENVFAVGILYMVRRLSLLIQVSASSILENINFLR